MDSLIQDLSHLSRIILAILILSILVSSKSRSSSKLKTPLEGASSWPIIGHLPLLLKSDLPHRSLASKANKHRPIFTIWLEVLPVLAVSYSEMAKECFTKNDVALCTRPRQLAPKILAYGYTMFAYMPYGPYGREVRKMATMELLSNRRVESSINPTLVSQADVAIHELHEHWIANKGDSGYASSNTDGHSICRFGGS